MTSNIFVPETVEPLRHQIAPDACLFARLSRLALAVAVAAIWACSGWAASPAPSGVVTPASQSASANRPSAIPASDSPNASAGTNLIVLNATVTGGGVVLGNGLYSAGASATLWAASQVDWQFDHWDGVTPAMATINPITLIVTEGLQPVAIMLPAPGLGRNEKPLGSSPGSTHWPALSRIFNLAQTDGNINNPEDYLFGLELFSHSLLVDPNGSSYRTQYISYYVLEGQTKIITGTNAPADPNGVPGQVIDYSPDWIVAMGGIVNVSENVDDEFGSANESHAETLGVAAVLTETGAIQRLSGGDFNQAFPTNSDYAALGFGSGSFYENYDGSISSNAGNPWVAGLRAGGGIDATPGYWKNVGLAGLSVSDGLAQIAFEARNQQELEGGDRLRMCPRFAPVAGYQWYKDNQPLMGQTNTFLDILVGLGDTGLYRIVATNGQAALASQPVAVYVYPFGAPRVTLDGRTIDFSATDAPSSTNLSTVALSTSITNGVIYYTVDGSDPGPEKSLYFGPFAVIHSSTLRAAAYSPDLTQSATNRPLNLTVLYRGSPRVTVNGIVLGFADTQAPIQFDQTQIAFTTWFTNGTIFYTTDGTEPSLSSMAYSTPFTVTKSALIRAIAFNQDFSESGTNVPVEVQIVPTFTLETTAIGSGLIVVSPNATRYARDTVVGLTALPASGWQFSHWDGDASGDFSGAHVVMDRNKNVRAIFVKISIFDLTILSSGGGSIQGSASGLFLENSAVSLLATPDSGWSFLGWAGDAATNGSAATVTMDADKTITAAFGTTVDVFASAGGHVQIIPAQGPYPYGTILRANAIPDPGYYLATWGSSVAGSPHEPVTVLVTNTGIVISAAFAPLPAGQYSLTTIAGQGGTVTNNPAKGAFSSGQPVTVTAIPDPGYKFAGWTGDVISTNNPLALTMTSNITVQAVFQALALPAYMVSTSVTGQGTITVTPAPPILPGVSNVWVTATPSPGWVFTGWTGLDATGPRELITVSGNLNITATFTYNPPATNTLATQIVGQGTVLLDPPGGIYSDGTVVTLTASPIAGWGFVRWSGDISNISQQTFLTVQGNQNVTALFQPLGTLTTQVNGQGQIQVSPLQTNYLASDVVTLTAVPSPGWVFTGWSGLAAGTNNPININVTQATPAVANFGFQGPILSLVPVNIQSGQLGINVSAAVGVNIIVQSSVNLIDWTPLGSPVAGQGINSPIAVSLPIDPSTPEMFFRLSVE